MDIKHIAKPLAFALFTVSGSRFDGRVAVRSAREATFGPAKATSRRVSAPWPACPPPPKATKPPDGPVRASAYPRRNGALTAV